MLFAKTQHWKVWVSIRAADDPIHTLYNDTVSTTDFITSNEMTEYGELKRNPSGIFKSPSRNSPERLRKTMTNFGRDYWVSNQVPPDTSQTL
jgi:hypothetical protein